MKSPLKSGWPFLYNDALMRTRIKICGITRVQDAMEAVAQGVDALGLVFYPPSPRHVSIEQAREIIAALPPFITTVGLFVNEKRETIQRVVRQTGIDLLQFHGDETPEYCAAHERPWIKAIRMKDGVNIQELAAHYREARGLLLDAYRPGVPGGTGETFDWNRIPRELAGRIILAGGLNADNVAAAVKTVRPYAVDVSGGVEAEKGIKDVHKISRFIRGVTIGEE